MHALFAYARDRLGIIISESAENYGNYHIKAKFSGLFIYKTPVYQS